MAMVLAHGGTVGLLLESLAVGLFMLLVWLFWSRDKARDRGRAAAGRPPQKPARAQDHARGNTAARRPKRAPATAKRRR
jgi:hypothetical protein